MLNNNERNKKPEGSTEKDSKIYNFAGELIEFYGGKWLVVLNGDCLGWWRYHSHYDRDGYCDNPARGY